MVIMATTLTTMITTIIMANTSATVIMAIIMRGRAAATPTPLKAATMAPVMTARMTRTQRP